VACLRSGIAAVALLTLLPGAAARRALRPTGGVWLVALVYGATLASFVASNKMTTAANAIFLQSTAPLYLILLAPLLLGERIRRRDLAFLALFAVGLAFFAADATESGSSATDPRAGNVFALLSGLFWALTLLGLRRLGASSDANQTAVIAGNVLVFVVCLPFALPIVARPLDTPILLYLGVLQIGLAYVWLTRALRRVPAFEAALILLVEPLFNPVWAWLVHGERPGPWALAGGGVILLATVLKTSRETIRPASTPGNQ
jgi:drug/metabolite transporter (DMT)-like permease